ncbi:MAG TPA: Flp pilus assembly protein CpaB [Stellaceae bacterium]|nr:Flp pilus assembly protein CpaB [Stellaceae bacterium]
MRARTLILLFVAIVLAGGTALLARSYLAAQRAQETQATPVAPVARSVLVARADIRRGQILRPDDLTWQVWPDGSLDKNYIVSGGPKKPDSFVGWVAINPIAGGEPITDAKIISPGNRGFLAAVLRPGMRAISVPVTITSGISGFVFPGDYVDLLLTYPVPSQSKFEHKAAETVMHNVRVIGMDQRVESKAGEVVPAHTATFEVSPKQSEVIALATQIGQLSLSLHSLVTASGGEGGAAAGAAPGGLLPPPADSFDAAAVTYTVDSEISPLLPKFGGSGKEAGEGITVTILRGSKSEAAKLGEAANVTKGTGTPREPTNSATAGGT